MPDGAPATSSLLLDRSIETLRSRADSWSTRSIDDRIADIETIRSRTIEAAPDLVADSARAKGLPPSMWGEEWVAGPMTVLRTLRFLHHTLDGIRRRGEVPLPEAAIRELSSGQVVIDVLPADRWDRILYRGWRGAVRMDPEIGLGAARHHLGGSYTKPELVTSRVALVLGAGNVSSIAPLDLVHKLFVEGHVALLKFNPVNDYIGPHIEHAFGELMAQGFVRTAYGDAGVGHHLVHHGGFDEIHLTGSERTHDAIVFGTGDEGPRRKAASEPLLTVPITSELGNVSPVVVVPGEWSSNELDHQAEHIATQLLQNAGYNCNAAKVLVLPERWPQADELLLRIGQKMESQPRRPPYYPGSEERYRLIVEAGGELRVHGSGPVPPTMVEIDSTQDHPAFVEEAFCRVMAVTRLPGDDVGQFLDRAVAFCNERLRGSLNVTLIADPATITAHPVGLERAVDDLRYGTIGVNVWAAVGFPLGVTPWGAHPGHTLADVGSGIGFVHNARLIDRPQKTVVRAPFVMRPKPAWSVFHRRAAAALRAATMFEGDPRPSRLPRLLAAAARP